MESASDQHVVYDGKCTVCGWEGRFEGTGGFRGVGGRFACGGCRATLRFRDEAAVLVQELGRGLHLTLDSLVDDQRVREANVYFVGERGPVRERLARLPNYVESRYVSDGELGSEIGARITVQDLQQLSFADDSFDLIVSSHVMEHVPDPWKALAEVRRVLRSGGRYVFSVPYRNPGSPDTRTRAVIEKGNVRHIEDPLYHNAPEGRSLVFHDFGADLVDRGHDIGLDVRIVRPHLPVQVALGDVVVVAYKPMTSGRP